MGYPSNALKPQISSGICHLSWLKEWIGQSVIFQNITWPLDVKKFHIPWKLTIHQHSKIEYFRLIIFTQGVPTPICKGILCSFTMNLMGPFPLITVLDVSHSIIPNMFSRLRISSYYIYNSIPYKTAERFFSTCDDSGCIGVPRNLFFLTLFQIKWVFLWTGCLSRQNKVFIEWK